MKRRGRRFQRRRLARARTTVEGFQVRNWHQKHLKAILTSMLDYMEVANHGGLEREVERWWGAFVAYQRVLESPELESGRRRTVLRRVLDVPWERFAEVARWVAEE